MDEKTVQKIMSNPTYQSLKKRRSRLGWSLTAAMMAVYYGFIVLVAFNKEFLSQKIGDGVTTIGIPIGIGVIIFTVIVTTIYVIKANRTYDDMTAKITREVLE